MITHQEASYFGKIVDDAMLAIERDNPVYEYFLSQFASAEGKKGGQFYTPRCIVRLLVTMLAPYRGRVYDPCCGSGGMFVQSEKFIEEYGGRVGDISIYGQESNHTTWRLIRVMIKCILRKHGYPPDKQERATLTVLEQAEVLCAAWAMGE